MFDGRTTEFWIALGSAALYVYKNSNEKAIHHRTLVVASSAGFGYSLADDLSKSTPLAEGLSCVIITVFSHLLIDAVTAIFADRDFLKEVVKKWVNK
mgnify:CR=1 FL=1